MKFVKILSAVGLFVLASVYGLADVANSPPVTQHARLEELSQAYTEWWGARRSPLYDELSRSDVAPQRQLNEDPDIELIYLDDRGLPIFYRVDNLNAAKTVSTDDVWPGGSGGFALDGSTTLMGQLGIWDNGAVLTTHQELSGE